MKTESGVTPLLVDDQYCFGCGRDNPIGLHLEFVWNDGFYETRWTPERIHQGWAGRAHGGIIALVLDEILSRAALTTYHGQPWVTAELTTRFLRPARIGIPLLGQAKVETAHKRMITCTAEIREQDKGTLIAAGHAKMMCAK